MGAPESMQKILSRVIQSISHNYYLHISFGRYKTINLTRSLGTGIDNILSAIYYTLL